MVEQPQEPGEQSPDPVASAAPTGELAELRRQVAAYVAAGADEAVQRVISSVHRVSRRLNQWYDQQLADLDVSGGEWAVLSELARADDNLLTPTQLATLAHVAPSSMTHRLDRMVERDLVQRTQDPSNRTRVLVQMTDRGWELYGSTIRESNVVEADLMRGLTTRQVADLAHLLEKLLAGLDHSPLDREGPDRSRPDRTPLARPRRRRPADDAGVDVADG